MHMTPNPIDPRKKREAARESKRQADKVARMAKLNNAMLLIGSLLLLALFLLR
jgi:hypothetical protein